MTESALVENEESRSSADTITIKVQTSAESMKYSIASVSSNRETKPTLKLFHRIPLIDLKSQKFESLAK